MLKKFMQLRNNTERARNEYMSFFCTANYTQKESKFKKMENENILAKP